MDQTNHIYKIYLRGENSSVSEKTVTNSREEAETAFFDLVSRSSLDDSNLEAVLVFNGRYIARHEFRLNTDDCATGPIRYWRGRDRISWPTCNQAMAIEPA